MSKYLIKHVPRAGAIVVRQNRHNSCPDGVHDVEG